MEFLRFLEGLRNPFADAVFSFITHFGEETVIIIIGLLFFWCIDKKQGYYILFVGFAGTIANQFLKLAFRIPRPWVLDPSLSVVEGARITASGYSFPSGHTQAAVGIFGCVARIQKNRLIRVLCITVCAAVPLSRMYLGVHTPLDVGVSLATALILVFVMYPVVAKASRSPKSMRLFFAVMTVLSVIFLLFVKLYKFPADIDAENLSHGIKNAYKIFGCIIGLWFAFEIDEKFIHFETKAVRWVQVLKLTLGIIPLFLIESGLKEPLYLIFNRTCLADGVRYFLITAFAGCVWPITFKYFSKLSQNKKN